MTHCQRASLDATAGVCRSQPSAREATQCTWHWGEPTSLGPTDAAGRTGPPQEDALARALELELGGERVAGSHVLTATLPRIQYLRTRCSFLPSYSFVTGGWRYSRRSVRWAVSKSGRAVFLADRWSLVAD